MGNVWRFFGVAMAFWLGFVVEVWGQEKDCDITTCGNQSIEPGGSVQLWASGAEFYQWEPATGLSCTACPDPMASPSFTTVYTVTGYNSGANLVYNGDFELGNVGFTSQYTYQSNLNPQATYYIDYTPSGHHGSFHGQDHTTGNGLFMMVNGAGTANAIVWQQVVNVQPNTDYAFSAWVCNLVNNTNAPQYWAKLQFSINGVQLGAIFNPPETYGYWINFYEIWNSGSNTQATITILNQNTIEYGNDFGLDDITFNGLEECSSSELTVFVADAFAVGNISTPPAICEGGSLSLTEPQVTGGSGWSGTWQISQTANGPFETLVNNNIPFSYNGYYLRYAVVYQGNNFYSNTVQITVNALPWVNILSDVDAVCNGEAVTLHANVNVVGIDVGDILCTDGSIVKPSSWPVAGKTAKGVVFYVDETGEHGWAAGLDFYSNTPWSTENVDIPNLPNITHWRDAIMEFDGYTNTQIIRAFGDSSKYPAAWAVDFDHGWYLPATGQLNILYGVHFIVNASLELVGGTPYPINDIYGWRGWSSNEWSSEWAIGVYSDGDVGFTVKNFSTGFVRPVISF